MENKLRLALKIANENKDVNIDDLLELIKDNPKITVNEIKSEENNQTKMTQISNKAKKRSEFTKKRWTDEEDSTLIHLLKTGKTHSDIGKILGRTRQSVSGRVEKLKSSGKYISYEKQRYTNEEIELICDLLEKYNYKISDIDKSEIKALASLTERTEKAILTRLYKQLELIELENLRR